MGKGCTAGNWDLTSVGLTSIPFGTSCAQGLQVLLRYIPSRFPAFSTCCFPLCLSTPGRLSALEGNRPQPSAPSEQFNRRRNGARNNPSNPTCRTTPDQLGQNAPAAHADDAGSDSFAERPLFVFPVQCCLSRQCLPLERPLLLSAQTFDYDDDPRDAQRASSKHSDKEDQVSL